jgi:hypothetical protein
LSNAVLEKDGEGQGWSHRVTNEVAHRVKEKNILHTVKKRANWVVHIVSRNCLLKPVSVGKVKGRILVKGRRERRCKQLLYDLKELEIDTGNTWNTHL